MGEEKRDLLDAYEWVLEIDPGQKGGPGSGHWGHAGRPGQVGGSQSGRMSGHGQVNREYFTKGPGKKIVASLTDKQREAVLVVITNMKVQPRHLQNLHEITTEPHPEIGSVSPNCVTWDNCHQLANYVREGFPPRNSIHINPAYLGSIHPALDWVGHELVIGRNILAHELGHHITTESRWALTPYRGGTDASFILRDAWAGRAGYEGWRPEYEKMGMREYSFKKESEFRADCWLVYQYGRPHQQARLAEYLDVDSLDELFGE